MSKKNTDKKKNNVLKRLDPRMVLYCYLACFILLFVAEGLIGAGVTLLCSVGVWSLSEMQLNELWKKIRYAVIIFFLICVLVAIASSVLFALGLFLRVAGFTILTVIYYSINSTYDRLDSVTGAFRAGNVISMNFSRVFDFLPSLGKNMRGLVLAARYRGMYLERMTVWQKVKLLFILQIPALQKAYFEFRRFKEVTETRCYDAEANRSRMKAFKYKKVDIFAASAVVLYAGLLIVLRILL